MIRDEFRGASSIHWGFPAERLRRCAPARTVAQEIFLPSDHAGYGGPGSPVRAFAREKKRRRPGRRRPGPFGLLHPGGAAVRRHGGAVAAASRSGSLVARPNILPVGWVFNSESADVANVSGAEPEKFR